MGIIQVRRANVILDVPDYQEQEYLSKGFDVIDANGNVVIKTTPSDINELKKAYTELTDKVKTLETENAELKKRLSKKTEPEPEEEELPELEPEEEDEVSEVDEDEPEEETRHHKKRKSKRNRD